MWTFVVQQILAQVGAVVEQKAPRQPRFVQPLHNAELMDGHAYVASVMTVNSRYTQLYTVRPDKKTIF